MLFFSCKFKDSASYTYNIPKTFVFINSKGTENSFYYIRQNKCSLTHNLTKQKDSSVNKLSTVSQLYIRIKHHIIIMQQPGVWPSSPTLVRKSPH